MFIVNVLGMSVSEYLELKDKCQCLKIEDESED